jgi:hypothetical protein
MANKGSSIDSFFRRQWASKQRCALTIGVNKLKLTTVRAEAEFP